MILLSFIMNWLLKCSLHCLSVAELNNYPFCPNTLTSLFCYSLFKFQGGDIGIITSVLSLFFYCLPVYYDKPWNLNLYKVVKLINRQVCKLQYAWNKKPV